jgi:hypothetical protein
VAAAFPMAPLPAATLLVAATVTVAAGGAAIVAAAGRGGVAAARASAAEQAGSVDGGGDTQQTGSQGCHDDAIHCKTPKTEHTETETETTCRRNRRPRDVLVGAAGRDADVQRPSATMLNLGCAIVPPVFLP